MHTSATQATSTPWGRQSLTVLLLRFTTRILLMPMTHMYPLRSEITKIACIEDGRRHLQSGAFIEMSLRRKSFLSGRPSKMPKDGNTQCGRGTACLPTASWRAQSILHIGPGNKRLSTSTASKYGQTSLRKPFNSVRFSPFKRPPCHH